MFLFLFCFVFCFLFFFFSLRNVRAKLVKISKVLDILFVEPKTRVRMLKVISLVFVVLMCRSTSLESGLTSPLKFRLFLRSLPVLLCHRQSRISWPSPRDIAVITEEPLWSLSIEQWQVEKELGCFLAGHLLLFQIHLTFRRLRELMTWCHSIEQRFLYKLVWNPVTWPLWRCCKRPFENQRRYWQT